MSILAFRVGDARHRVSTSAGFNWHYARFLAAIPKIQKILAILAILQILIQTHDAESTPTAGN
jgi:hypothetical protein